jgi:Domain of unknown function (DUF4342)
MSERTWTETIKTEAGQLVDRVAQIIREGNVRRVVVKQGDRIVAEFPLTVGVVGAVLSPVLAALGAIAALLTDCSVEVERVARTESSAAAGSAATGSSSTPAGSAESAAGRQGAAPPAA